jgi:general secretion pathway protein G
VKKIIRGLTLLDGVALLAILVLLALAIVVNVAGSTNCGGRGFDTQAGIKQLQMELELFKVEQGLYPEKLEDLFRKPSYVDAAKWPRGGYVAEEPIDAWGRPFYYACPGVRGPYDIVSWGADGKPGGEGVNADLWSHPPRR